MKGLIVAAIVLGVVLALVAVNVVYVRHVSDEMLDRLEALPALPDTSGTPEKVRSVKRYLEKHTTALSLSVNYNLLARAGESLTALEAHAEIGDERQYVAALAVLKDLCRELSRAERFDIQNIF